MGWARGRNLNEAQLALLGLDCFATVPPLQQGVPCADQ